MEQHSDEPNKLHVYVYSKHPFKNKGPDKGKPWFKIETMPAIEVKGTRQLMFCSPSMHKGGHRYQFLNKDKDKMLPPVADELENIIDKILQAHNIEYLTKGDKKTKQLLGNLDEKKTVSEGSRHNTLLTKMNALLHDFIRVKPLEEIERKCIEFNNLYCKPPLPADEFQRMWADAQVHVIEKEQEKDAATAGSGGVLIEGLISVESAKRLNSGAYAVKGMIIQVSNVIQMVETTDFKCQNCSKTASHKYNPPLLSLPSDLLIGKVTRDKCETCGERFSFEVVGHTEVPGMKIQLQDERKQNALEGLDVVLFGTDTINVRTGENCMVFGELHVVQRRDVRVTYLFGNTKGGAIEYEKPEVKDIELTPEDLEELDKFQQQPDVAERLTQQFAPTIINHNNKKLAILLQYIGAPESQHFRGRIHALLIGPPGLAKTALAREAYQLGYPSSRFSSAQGASVKTITAIIDKENEFYVIRLGVLPQARNSLCILDEVASHSTEEQKYLFGCMEEGKFTIDKHGFHREIDAPTSVLGTTNPETADWFNNVVEKGQIPLRKELVDRYDYVLVFKATTEREKKLDYAKQRLGIYRQLQDGELVVDYTFLQKFIRHARSFESVRISEEAEAMIAEYWSKLDPRIFPTNRVLETIQRTSMAFARLHFSNTVTVDIVNEAVAFITEMFQEFDQTVAVVKDPRDIACEEVIKYLEETPGQVYTFEECLNHAIASNTLVEAYFGKVVDNQSKKFKELANRFKLKEVSSAVSIVSLKPLKLVFNAVSASETETEQKEGNK